MENGIGEKTAAYLTHELRAPLTAMLCALELMRENSALSEQDSKLLSLALRNGERLRYLIQDILELSKIQSGRMKIAPVACAPATLAREALEGLLPWAQHRGISLALECPADLPPVSADPRRTVQILTNLLSNAIKFTPTGGRITVSAEQGKRDLAGYVVFAVRDTGCGIRPEDMEGLFHFFHQAGPPDQQQQGSGLGLALSRSLVEFQGGAVWAESRPGEGATFRFTLPMHLGSTDSGEKNLRLPPSRTDA